MDNWELVASYTNEQLDDLGWHTIAEFSRGKLFGIHETLGASVWKLGKFYALTYQQSYGDAVPPGGDIDYCVEHQCCMGESELDLLQNATAAYTKRLMGIE